MLWICGTIRIFRNDSNIQNWNHVQFEEIKSGESLLPFCSESFIFEFATQKEEDKYI